MNVSNKIIIIIIIIINITFSLVDKGSPQIITIAVLREGSAKCFEGSAWGERTSGKGEGFTTEVVLQMDLPERM